MTTADSAGSDHCRVTRPDNPFDRAAWFEYYRHLFPYDEAARRIPHADRVLEVGCGSGYGTHFLFLKVKASEIIGSDMSEQAIAYARAHYPGIRFIQAFGTQLPFPPGYFDAVVSFQVIEHISAADDYLREIHRILKQGGLFFLTTPNRRLRLLPWQKPWNPYHVHEYYDRELLSLVRTVFTDVTIHGIMATPELMTMEQNRVRHNAFLFPLKKLYRAISPIIPKCMIRMLRSSSANMPQTGGMSSDISVNGISHFFISMDTKHCLDFFIIARKTENNSTILKEKAT